MHDRRLCLLPSGMGPRRRQKGVRILWPLRPGKVWNSMGLSAGGHRLFGCCHPINPGLHPRNQAREVATRSPLRPRKFIQRLVYILRNGAGILIVIFSGEMNNGFLGDAVSVAGSRKSLNLHPVLLMHPGQDDTYSQFSQRTVPRSTHSGHYSHSMHHNFQL